MKKLFLAMLLSFTPVIISAADLSSSESSATGSISGGDTLFSAPTQCNPVTEKTVWNGSSWTCVADGFAAPTPPPAVASSGSSCSGFGGIEGYLCQQWNNNLARKGGQPTVGGLVRAPGMTYSQARSCPPFGSNCRNQMNAFAYSK